MTKPTRRTPEQRVADRQQRARHAELDKQIAAVLDDMDDTQLTALAEALATPVPDDYPR